MERSPLCIGIAGVGFGAAIHAPVLQSLPGVTVVAIAASHRQRAADAAARLGIPVACEGIEELLDRPLDAVSLALPPRVNEVAVAAALDREVAILSEKPLAYSAERAAEFAARAIGRTTAVDFEFAELASFAACKAVVESGRLGAVQRVRVDWRTRAFAYKIGQWSWKTDQAQAGGVLSQLGTHALYLLEWLCGELREFAGQSGRRHADDFAPTGAILANDSTEWSFAFRSGATGTAYISNADLGKPRHCWQIEFEHGTAIVENAGHDYMGGFRFVAMDAAGVVLEEVTETTSTQDGRLQPFRSLAERFTAAARQARPCQPDFSAGARVQALVARLQG